MAFTRVLTIVSLASLPLAALTARAFFVQPVDFVERSEIPRYEAEPALRGRIAKETGRLTTGDGDPAGWRTAMGTTALPLPYDVAVAIRLADRAARETDIADVNAAVTELNKLLDEPRRLDIETWRPAGHALVAALGERERRLEIHRRWLDDRANVAAEIRKAEATLADRSIGVGAEATIQILQNLRQRYPGVVPDNAEAEPATKRTKSEEDMTRDLLKRAEFRRDYQRAKQGESATLRRASLDTFVRTHEGGTLDARDHSLLDEAKRLLDEATREVLWSQVQVADSAGDLAQSLCEWLEATIESDSVPKGRKVADTWLAKRISAGPDVARFEDLQEGIIDGGNGAKRLLGVFDAVRETNKWRWWIDRAQKANPDFPRGDGRRPPVALKGDPMARPVLVDLLETYRQQRTRFLNGPLDLDDEASAGAAFAAVCEDLRQKARKHAGMPVVDADQHPLQQDYDAILEQFSKSLVEASQIAREFDAAVRRSGLANRLKQ